MIPRFSPNYSWKEIFSCFLPTDPKAVLTFEKSIAKRSGHQEAISFRYGRTGLFYLLKALGAQGKKVILPSYSCVSVAHAIILSGNTPVFLDNTLNSYQPDPQDYFSAIDAETIMIIPTHLFGMSEETEDLHRKIKRNYPHIFILQDCAHSFFCKDSTDKTVTLSGDGGLFGMNISKLINTGFGGMLTLQNSELAQKIRNLVEQDRKKRKVKSSLRSRSYVFLAAFAFSRFFYRFTYFLTHKTDFLKAHTDYYDPFTIDFPMDFFIPMISFEASIGLKSLNKYEKRIENRQKIARFYYEHLQGIPNLTLPFFKKGNTWSHFPILIPPTLRETIINQLEKSYSVEIGKIVDYSIAGLPSYTKRGHPECPLASHAVGSVINLPLCFQEGLFPLSEKKTQRHLTHIVEYLRQVLTTTNFKNYSRSSGGPS